MLTLEVEVDRNFDYFQTVVDDLMRSDAGRVALLRHCKIAGLFDLVSDAIVEGDRRFPDGVYSIQEVTNQPLDLGFYSHVIDLGLRH